MTRNSSSSYYEIIGVQRTATPEEIKVAYRQMALKVHPDKDKAPGADERFKALHEAWQTLSDPVKRRTYDYNFEKKEFDGSLANCSRGQGQTYSNYSFHQQGNGYAYAKRNYNTTGHFNNYNGNGPNYSGGRYQNQQWRPRDRGNVNNANASTTSSFCNNNGWRAPSRPEPAKSQSSEWRWGTAGKENFCPTTKAEQEQQEPDYSKPPPLVKDPPFTENLNVTLEELCFGSVRRVTITRDVLAPDGVRSSEKETLEVEVKPGWKEGTKITYAEKGDIAPGHIAADIVLVIKEIKHSTFERDGADLKCNLPIPLRDALLGTLYVPVLDDDEPMGLRVEFGKPIAPGTVHRIPERGMPDRKNGCIRGDLVITFDVRFPDKFDAELLELAEKLPVF